MNVEIGTEAVQFLFLEHINGIFFAVWGIIVSILLCTNSWAHTGNRKVSNK
jgi:hypothetical protein